MGVAELACPSTWTIIAAARGASTRLDPLASRVPESAGRQWRLQCPHPLGNPVGF